MARLITVPGGPAPALSPMTQSDPIAWMRRIAAILIGAILLTLSACDRNGAPSPADVVASGGNEATRNKFALYTEAFNELVDESFGIEKSYTDYVASDIPAAAGSDTLFFHQQAPTLERALGKLEQGRALDGDRASARADAAVDTLVTQGQGLLSRWTDLTPYYESRAYREDDLARGKAEHPALIAAYQGTLSSIGDLETALTEHLRARDTARIAAYRDRGDTFAYTLMSAMQQADLFTSAVIEGDMAEADRRLPLVTAANADLREAAADIPADQAYNKVAAPLIASTLDRMVGNYRDFKRSGDDSHRFAVIETYNTSVDLMNDVQFAS